jgi:hypothetical protein
LKNCKNQEIRLPRVGQTVYAHPYFGIDSLRGKIPAIVNYVSDKGWFSVTFELGYREAYRFDAPEVEFY